MSSPSKLGLVYKKGLFRGAIDVREVNNQLQFPNDSSLDKGGLDKREQGEHR